MGIEDLVNQGNEFLEENKEKIEGVLKSDKAEEISDNVLGAAAGFVKKVAPEGAAAQIDDVRNKIDGAVGNE